MKYLFAALLCIVCTGCLDWGIAVKVNKDGSGTITETFIESEGMLQDAPPDINILDSMKANAAVRFGEVTVQSSREYKTGNKTAREVVYSFTNLNKVFINFMGNAPDESLEQNQEPEQVPYRFSFSKNSNGTSNILVKTDTTNLAKTGIGAQDNSPTDKATRKLALQMAKGLKIRVSVQTESPIIKSNALFKSAQGVEFINCDFYNLTKLAFDNKQFRKEMGALSGQPTSKQIALMKKHKFLIETQHLVSIQF